jgi:UDP-N-acetylglucosamine transferase subunit ALG13
MNDDSEVIHYYVRYNEIYEIIHDAHIATGHGGGKRIMYSYEVNSKY